MAYDVALSTMITAPVSLRLKTLALLENRPLTQLVDDLLDRALPSTKELGSRLSRADGSDFAADKPATPDTQKAGTAISPAVPAQISASAA